MQKLAACQHGYVANFLWPANNFKRDVHNDQFGEIILFVSNHGVHFPAIWLVLNWKSSHNCTPKSNITSMSL